MNGFEFAVKMFLFDGRRDPTSKLDFHDDFGDIIFQEPWELSRMGILFLEIQPHKHKHIFQMVTVSTGDFWYAVMKNNLQVKRSSYIVVRPGLLNEG